MNFLGRNFLGLTETFILSRGFFGVLELLEDEGGLAPLDPLEGLYPLDPIELEDLGGLTPLDPLDPLDPFPLEPPEDFF
jgi:hypothetical protein